MGTIHLINYGKVPAIPASEVKEGMKIVYNYGENSKVLSVEDISESFVKIKTLDRLGKIYSQKRKKTSLVAAFWPKQKN